MLQIFVLTHFLSEKWRPLYREVLYPVDQVCGGAELFTKPTNVLAKS